MNSEFENVVFSFFEKNEIWFYAKRAVSFFRKDILIELKDAG
jgi:hypothetical protein